MCINTCTYNVPTTSVTTMPRLFARGVRWLGASSRMGSSGSRIAPLHTRAAISLDEGSAHAGLYAVRSKKNVKTIGSLRVCHSSINEEASISPVLCRLADVYQTPPEVPDR